MYCSAYAAAGYLKNIPHFQDKKKVYVMGETGIFEELHNVGIRIFDNEVNTNNNNNTLHPLCTLHTYIHTRISSSLVLSQSNRWWSLSFISISILYLYTSISIDLLIYWFTCIYANGQSHNGRKTWHDIDQIQIDKEVHPYELIHHPKRNNLFVYISI